MHRFHGISGYPFQFPFSRMLFCQLTKCGYPIHRQPLGGLGFGWGLWNRSYFSVSRDAVGWAPNLVMTELLFKQPSWNNSCTQPPNSRPLLPYEQNPYIQNGQQLERNHSPTQGR